MKHTRSRAFAPWRRLLRHTCLLLLSLVVCLCAPVWVQADEPTLSSVFPDDEFLDVGTPMPIRFEANAGGVLEVAVRVQGADAYAPLSQQAVDAGPGSVSWDGQIGGSAVQPGIWEIQLTLVDSAGIRSLPHVAFVEVTGEAASEGAPEQTAASPTAERREPSDERQLSPYPDPHELCSFGLDIDNMDVYNPEDQAKIWEAMMQPITVLNVGPKEHVYPLVSPDADPKDPANLTGQLHGTTQGVHVLEQLDNGWSLIEAYSADGYGSPDEDKFHGLDAKLIQGYVRTNKLKTAKPYAKIGLLIDKVTQRMYIFRDGALFTELLISTGIPTASQSWNETPAGEFLVDSWVGMFANEKMMCDLALRINGGVLLHEVPHRPRADGTRNYESYEPYLGKKASHGCIRIQRMRNNDGVNMAWLWNNLKRNTKVLIWDDAGRADIPVPESSKTVYYNPDGGKSYHSDANCASVKERFLPLSPLPYTALYEAPTNELIPCYGCVPFFKVADPSMAEVPDEVLGADMQGE